MLTQQLLACGIFNFIAADKTNEILQKNNINMPRHLTQNFIIALKELIPTKYLITGGISIWKKGSIGFSDNSTEVSASLTMYDLETGKVAITAQNHCFCVDIDSLNKADIEVTHINLNDNTLEGMKHKKLPIFSVQFHPEASPGPHDAGYLFKRFVNMMEKKSAETN